VLMLPGMHVAAQSAPPTAEPQSPLPGWTLTGSVRQQYEHFRNEEWGAAPADPSGYLLQRYMFRVSRPMAPWATATIEMKSGLEVGRAGGPRVPDKDVFDLHQGYVDLHRGALNVRVGRQELQFGSSRLVSVRDLNVRQSFDAVRGTVANETWRLDAFASWPATTRPDALDDVTDRTRRLWGVYAVRHPRGSQHTVDVYYLGYGRDNAHFDGGRGRELRHSVGTRLSGTQESVDYNVEAVAQWGSLADRRIRAWGVASDVGYRLSLPLRPRVGLRADTTSGDRDPTDVKLGTFNGLFASAAYFGLIATAGPANHVDVQPQLGLEVSHAVSVSAGWLVFWRREVADGIYTWSGQLLRSAVGTHSRFVGQSPSVTLRWTVNAHLSLSGDLSGFTAGPFIRESGAGENSTFVRTTVAYRF
jgi:alginate export protein